MKRFSRAQSSRAFLRVIGKGVTPEERFPQIYQAMKIKLGMIDVSPDPYPDPETGITGEKYLTRAGQEELMDSLVSFANLALRYLGAGLFMLGERTFNSVRRISEKRFMNYKSMMTNWKSRVWKNARSIDGQAFDAYTCTIVPHAEMVKRIQAVESIHKLLSNISGIYNANVPKNSDEWSTPECDKAIANLEKIGFKAKNLDMLNTISKQYANARKKQPLYLHGYTPKRILELMTRCEKLAEYGDEKYIQSFEDTYLKYSNQCEEFEDETSQKSFDNDLKEEPNPKTKKELQEREHESKIRAARLWWLAHFLKAAYTITGDILADIETLSIACERTMGKDNENN